MVTGTPNKAFLHCLSSTPVIAFHTFDSVLGQSAVWKSPVRKYLPTLGAHVSRILHDSPSMLTKHRVFESFEVAKPSPP